MDGAHLSGLFADKPPPTWRYAYGDYSNSFDIRHPGMGAVRRQPARHFQLYDLEADPGETRNLAARNPEKVRELYELVRRRAGGRLPYYPEV